MTGTRSEVNFDRLQEVKSILRSLLISKGKCDVNLRQLNAMYREIEGTQIPYREFNYSTLNEFLFSMPDTLRIQANRDNELCAYYVNTEKSAHVSSLVARQKKPPRKSKSNYSYRPRKSFYYSSKPVQNNFTPPPVNVVPQVLQEMKSSPFRSNLGIHKADILVKIRERLGTHSLYTIENLNTHLYQLSHLIDIKNDYIYFKDQITNQKDDVKQQIPVNEKPIGSNNCNGYASKTETGCCIADSENKSESQLQQTDSANIIVTERIKIRLQKLIEKHPEGIWCSELPNLYKTEYNVQLEYYDLGFNSITEFVATLPDIFVIVEPPNTNRQMVLNAKAPVDNLESNKQTKTLASLYNFDDYIASDPEPVPNKLSSAVSRSLIPEGVMNFNETVDQISVTTLVSEEYIEVNISEIFSPSFFWITLRKNKKKIKNLMSELHDFYQFQDLDNYKIPQAVLEPGLNIACVYANIWHRGIIKKIKPDGFVIILFYDYGTVKTYHPDDLYFLSKKFSVLSAQAIACGLHNIRPIGGNEWSSIASNKFINKVWNIPLIAIISSIDEENNTMMITLTDTSDDMTDLHLNDWMVENQLAQWGKMDKSVPIHKLYKYEEAVLIKMREEYYEYENKENKIKMEMKDNYSQHNENKANIQNNNLQQTDIKASSTISPNSTSNYIESLSCDTSNVATLVKQNMDLTKETHTIAQAILLNMPINKSSVQSSENFDIINNVKVGTNTVENQSNSKFISDFDSNLSSINMNISEMNNTYFSNESIQNEFTQLNQNSEDNFNHHLSCYHSVCSCLSNLDNKFVENNINTSNPNESMQSQQHPNKCERRTSPYSVHSNDSNYNFEQISNYINNQQQNATNENSVGYHQLSFSDGTPYYEVKMKNNVSKSNTINIKYPTNFENLIKFNEFENNSNDINTSKNEKSSNNSIDQEEIDEGYGTPKICTPQSNSTFFSINGNNEKPELSATPSNTSMYTAIQLSEKCEKKIMHIIHLDNEGWICAIEFVDVFTNLRDQRVMIKLLESLRYDLVNNFKYVSRNTEFQLFSALDNSTLEVPREGNKKIISDFVLILVPLRDMLTILVNLEFLNFKMLKESLPLIKIGKPNVADVLYERYNNKILYDALNLIMQYKQFLQLQSSSNQ